MTKYKIYHGDTFLGLFEIKNTTRKKQRMGTFRRDGILYIFGREDVLKYCNHSMIIVIHSFISLESLECPFEKRLRLKEEKKK